MAFAGIFTGRNEVLAKVIFLHLFVILFTGEGVWPPDQKTPPGPDPPETRPPPRPDPPGPDPPRDQTPLGPDPPGDQTPSRSSRLWNTVNVRPVHILLECILVLDIKKTELSRNVHYKGIKIEDPNFVVSSADTSIKVTDLPLTYAVYPGSKYCECSLIQK